MLPLCFLGSLVGCESPQPVASQPPFRAVTATEVFNLKTKCSELGDKLLAINPVSAPFTHDQTSHYNPVTNNCYIDISVHKANMTESLVGSQTVYDGQSREGLVWIEVDEKGVIKSAWIKDGPDNATGTLALLKIQALMTGDPAAEKAYLLSASALEQVKPVH